MGRFGSLQQWDKQSKAVEAPSGMRQAASQARQYESGSSRFSALGKWTSEQGYVGAAQSWYTGANMGGTENGWDTDFWDRAMKQQQKLADEGRLGQQFETEHATDVDRGVVVRRLDLDRVRLRVRVLVVVRVLPDGLDAVAAALARAAAGLLGRLVGLVRVPGQRA